jgi:hypothetical protein
MKTAHTVNFKMMMMNNMIIIHNILDSGSRNDHLIPQLGQDHPMMMNLHHRKLILLPNVSSRRAVL